MPRVPARAPRPAAPLWARGLLALAATVAALGVLELGLRLVYPTLPSLVGLAEATTTPPQGMPVSLPTPCRAVEVPAWQGDDSRIVAVGDSVTLGMGVARAEGFAARLVAARPGLVLDLRAEMGADLCRALGQLGRALGGATRPRAVLWGVFADDLMNHVVFQADGRPFAHPFRLASPWARALVSGSYLANAAWFQASLRLPGWGQARAVSEEALQVHRAALATTAERLRAAEVPLVVALVAPAGMPRCPVEAPVTHPCGWMRADLGILRSLFDAVGVPLVDLTSLWDGLPPVELAAERGGLPAIHPDPVGHGQLALALGPALDAALASAPRRPPGPR